MLLVLGLVFGANLLSKAAGTRGDGPSTSPFISCGNEKSVSFFLLEQRREPPPMRAVLVPSDCFSKRLRVVGDDEGEAGEAVKTSCPSASPFVIWDGRSGMTAQGMAS